MNTCEGTLVDEGGKTYIEFGEGCKIALPEKGRKPEVLAYAGKKVLFGMRPNDIHASAELVAKYPDRTVEVTVELTELLGAESNLYLSNGDNQFTAVIDTGSTNAKMGDVIRVMFDTEKIHLFDADTEKTITN